MQNKALPSNKRHTILRVLKTLWSFYPTAMPIIIACILFNAIVAAIPSVFMQNIISIIEESWQTGNWEAVHGKVLDFVRLLALFYILALASSIVYNQMIAVITQGFLKQLRVKLFAHMQGMPISYFDTHNHGDIMSHYTNDIDTLRQLVSQSIPQLLSAGVMVFTIFCIMVYYCLWLAVLVLLGVTGMLLVTKKIGGSSAKYFFRQQQALGEMEGFVEEMMNGQKVVKVFCHEAASKEEFDRKNDMLFEEVEKANKFANSLGPVLNNMGNLLYAVVAFVGGVLLVLHVPNLSISGLALSISIVVPFLNMTRQFAGNINQVSQQINAIAMALAGAQRIFTLLDEQPEQDEGYVTLENVEEVNGEIVPSATRTGMWAWRHPHKADGTVTYERLTGDVRLYNVDFSYETGKPVLQDVSLYAKPGQKIAFVGATGAGKTTVTNLLNRFYDIHKGKIYYDGINIEKIRKTDLRRSLGIVLQDTNLFTGTVMDNIRYGRLNATDEECIAAAKLAGADDFITRMPEGYSTELSGNGGNLSQGQRQLLAISRAAVADPPVMILDEATSSIDTRTEAIVQRGMDALMQGRTVFVIAHRLSTVKNSDTILVLEHGSIIERGAHAELLAQKGEYYQLYTGAFELE